MCEGHHFFDCAPSFLFCFCCFLRLLPPSSQVSSLLNGSYKDTWYCYGGVLCVVILWVNGRKYENLMQFNTSWLASLRAWYYFRFYFSFSCSGYDLTLIKKSHTLNCYLFLQKLQTYKLVVGVAEFTAKTINSDIAFHFLSLMSYSINKLKFHMLFTFKNFMFSDFT